MPREIDEKSIHLLIKTELGEDFLQLREMLNLAEEICDLAARENQWQADRLMDELLDKAREVIRANAERSKKKS